jgi:hypothetical protein
MLIPAADKRTVGRTGGTHDGSNREIGSQPAYPIATRAIHDEALRQPCPAAGDRSAGRSGDALHQPTCVARSRFRPPLPCRRSHRARSTHSSTTQSTRAGITRWRNQDAFLSGLTTRFRFLSTSCPQFTEPVFSKNHAPNHSVKVKAGWSPCNPPKGKPGSNTHVDELRDSAAGCGCRVGPGKRRRIQMYLDVLSPRALRRVSGAERTIDLPLRVNPSTF